MGNFQKPVSIFTVQLRNQKKQKKNKPWLTALLNLPERHPQEHGENQESGSTITIRILEATITNP